MALRTETIDAYNSFERKRKIYEQEYTIPEPPPIEEIDGHDLHPREQCFRRTKLPYGFDNWSDEDQLDFIDNEWEKINNGYWFFNNGKLVYLTGTHYFYINWWLIMITEAGKPKKLANPRYVDSDVDFFYNWDKAEKSKDIAGLVYITNRRDGKSYKFGCITYLRCIQYKNSNHGIQSKDKNSAEKFLKQIVDSWRDLPWFFKPLDNGVTNPTKGLHFSEPSKRLSNKNKGKRNMSTDDEYWNSHITYGSTTPTYYDGDNLLTYINDESGKNTEADVHRTLQIVLETMVAGSYITGKCGVTSTVEEMEKGGGANLKKIWDESDPTKLTALGRTQNRLIRYFKPAYFGLEGEDKNGIPFVNKYGETDWKRAKVYLEEERKSRSGETLAQFIRMYPFTIDEAFQLSQDCVFDAQNINATLNYNSLYVNDRNLQRGDFIWKVSMQHGEVVWMPNPEGHFYVSWMPNVEDRNKFRFIETEHGRQRQPTVGQIVGGIDPFSAMYTSDNRKSDGGFHLFRKFHPFYPEESNTFVLEYIHRPPAPEIFWEDCLKAAIFYSAQLLIEMNVRDFLHWARMNGFYEFFMDRPDQTHTTYSKKHTREKGIALSGSAPRDYLKNKILSFTYNELGYGDDGMIKKFMPFDRTLKDWLKFDPKKWTDYDATVSSGLALIASEVKTEIKEEVEVLNLLPRYDNSGYVSRQIN